MKQVAIIGSRDYQDMEQVRGFVNELSENTVVVSGGHPFDTREGAASGVDWEALDTAWRRGLNIICVPAHWTAHKRGAGFRRNPLIVRGADEVVAFWDGRSGGTKDTLEHAKKLNKPITIFLLNDKTRKVIRAGY